ncbi:alpha/beta hydrolase [Mycobacterium sp. ITM-2017-0098]|nr:alpha/beta hydrolase [Mycobacterium sp. ITM-2017-0098]
MSFRYDPRHRPVQPTLPAPDAFTISRAVVAEGVSSSFVHEGIGGAPLVLIHGYPETKRIWWRNIEALAAAGFEVIAPDLRGVGDSDIPPDDQHDIVTFSRDLHALVHDRLGHASCIIAASDIGGVVATDMIHRFPGFVDGLCVFNTVPPMGVDYSGIESFSTAAQINTLDPTADYQWMQGAFPNELAAMLASPEARRQWVAAMYTNRLWGSKYAFDQADVDFMTEPFADEARLRAGWATYQLAYGRAMSDFPLMDAVDVRTLVLFGPDDHVIGEDFVPRCERAFRNRIGPLVIPGAGHFLQWERADIFNQLLPAVFHDVIAAHRRA